MKKLCKSVRYWKIVFAYTFVFCLLCLTGCHPALSSDEQIQRFEKAGPITPEVDIDSVLRAKIHTGYYQVVPGDILELQMPAALRIISSDLSNWYKPVSGHDDVEPYLFRVSDAGIITLPIVGEMTVAGKKLTEIEIAVVSAYYPKYVANLPSVVCKVKEYQYRNVTVVGAVVKPGLYRLHSDEMSLVAALMKAGGIVEEGASLIIIQHAARSGEDEPRPSLYRPSDVRTKEGRDEPPKTTGSTALTAPAHSLDVEKKEVDLAFQQNDFPNTKGRLTVSRGKKVLHSAEVDVASEKERAAFVKNLGKLHQDTRSGDIEQALSQLAKKIERISNVSPLHKYSNDNEEKESNNIAEYEPNAPDTEPAKVSAAGHANSETIILPVKGLNIPFADVALRDGDIVEVERFDPAVFTVLGPVEKPGTFDYPPDIQYNLMQALAFAGGPDLLLDPRYVTIYRQDANGEIVSATFELDRKSLANASKIRIKPGDVISVEMTPETRARMILKEMFYIRVGYDIDEVFRSR